MATDIIWRFHSAGLSPFDTSAWPPGRPATEPLIFLPNDSSGRECNRMQSDSVASAHARLDVGECAEPRAGERPGACGCADELLPVLRQPRVRALGPVTGRAQSRGRGEAALPAS